MPSSSATGSSCSASPRRTPQGIELRVHPTLVPEQRLIASVEGAMNAVLVKGDAVGLTLYYGKGAGAADRRAVVADLVDVTRMLTADPREPRAASGVPARRARRLAVLPIERLR